MGKFWLHDAVAPLQTALGSYLELYPGYSTRSRSTGGFNAIMGIVMHHDADPSTGEDYRATDYIYVNAADKPIGNFHLHRSGKVIFGAAGAGNHAGRGGPITTSKGTVGKDLGNLFLIGIEASNNGIGESWPNIQLDNYMILVSTLCKVYGFRETDVVGHADWCQPSCPGRKIDPAGPTPKYPGFGGTSGRNTWKIAEVRKEIASRLNTVTPPPTNNWVALGATYSTPPATMTKGSTYPNVTWLQAVLCSMKTKDGKPMYNPDWVGADNLGGASQYNLYGNATDNSVRYFQSVNGLPQGSRYDTVTANTMYRVRGK